MKLPKWAIKFTRLIKQTPNEVCMPIVGGQNEALMNIIPYFPRTTLVVLTPNKSTRFRKLLIHTQICQQIESQRCCFYNICIPILLFSWIDMQFWLYTNYSVLCEINLSDNPLAIKFFKIVFTVTANYCQQCNF